MSPMTDRLIPTRRGHSLAARHLAGRGDPLVVLHAAGFHGRCYPALVERLATRFDVWSIDAPGHGHSKVPGDGDFWWQPMAADVGDALAALGGGPWRVFGHSLGGALALLVSRQRPGLIRSIYAYEPIIIPRSMFEARGPVHPLAVASRRRRDRFGSRAEVFERFASRPPLNQMRADALHAYVTHGTVEEDDGVRLRCAGESEARVYECDVTDLFDDAGELGSVVRGAQSLTCQLAL
mgnify:CR=1 FL=1